MCDMIKRNERCRGIVTISYFGYKDIKQITCIQLLDRIHSLLYHSFDLFRLTNSEKQLILQKDINIENNNDNNEYDFNSIHVSGISGSDDSNYELFMRSVSVDSNDSMNQTNNNKYIDKNFYKMHKIMRSKQTKLIQIRNQFRWHLKMTSLICDITPEQAPPR
eukprot:182367_1